MTKQEERDAAWRSSMNSRHRKLADRPKCHLRWIATVDQWIEDGHQCRCQKIEGHAHHEHKCHCGQRKVRLNP